MEWNLSDGICRKSGIVNMTGEAYNVLPEPLCAGSCKRSFEQIGRLADWQICRFAGAGEIPKAQLR